MNGPPGKNRARVALVVTRSWTENSSFGRERTLREISLALEAGYDIRIFRLHSILETRRVRDVAGAARSWLASVRRAAPLPLQCVVYGGAAEISQLVEALRAGDFHAIYVDSVRSQLLLRALRRALPNTRIVLDFDDLMSRRMTHLFEQRLHVSLGLLTKFFPKPVRWSIEGPLSSLISRYEAAALRNAEQEMVAAVENVVLVSVAERDLLRRQLPDHLRERVRALPPPAASARGAVELTGPYRFVFIGSDRLIQNRLAIDHLVATWRRLQPTAALHIYGRQDRPAQDAPNVHWHGFIEQVDEAYVPGSILVLPSLLAGGVKTKVIEAWSFGCPVLGNATSFEGLDLADYPLIREPDQWDPYLLDPDAHAAEWSAAARAGNAFVHSRLSRERYAADWRQLIAG